VITAALLTGAAIAGAMPFNNPPEDNMDPGQWQTPFPYQRNVYIGFCTSPHTWPIDPVAGYDLVPGTNCEHEGTDDGQLYPSDWISFDANNTVGGDCITVMSQEPQWFDEDPSGTGGSGRTGLIGFFLQESYHLDMTVHLDNWEAERPYKHVWFEMEYFAGGPITIQLGVTSAFGQAATIQPVTEDLGAGWYRTNFYAEFEPNPMWEEIQVSVWGDPAMSSSVLIDYVHIATECVPEPATLSLLLAVGGPLIRRKKFRTS